MQLKVENNYSSATKDFTSTAKDSCKCVARKGLSVMYTAQRNLSLTLQSLKRNSEKSR